MKQKVLSCKTTTKTQGYYTRPRVGSNLPRPKQEKVLSHCPSKQPDSDHTTS